MYKNMKPAQVLVPGLERGPNVVFRVSYIKICCLFKPRSLLRELIEYHSLVTAWYPVLIKKTCPVGSLQLLYGVLFALDFMTF